MAMNTHGAFMTVIGDCCENYYHVNEERKYEVDDNVDEIVGGDTVTIAKCNRTLPGANSLYSAPDTRYLHHHNIHHHHHRRHHPHHRHRLRRRHQVGAVSYTHLTLPTIYSV